MRENTPSPSRSYRSKVDLWIPIVLLVAFAIPLVMVWQRQEPIARLAIYEGAALVVCLALIYSIRYVVDGRKLNVYIGPLRMGSYAVADITRIAPSHSILSAPAASLDRLRIHLSGRPMPVLVSPKEKQAFISHLRTINPEISLAPSKDS